MLGLTLFGVSHAACRTEVDRGFFWLNHKWVYLETFAFPARA